MKIGVLEWNVAALGGRQRTMLAFADYFLELGHEVHFYSNFSDPDPSYTLNTFLAWHHLPYLTPNHVHGLPLQRRYLGPDVPPEWQELDVLLVSYGGFGHLQRFLPGVRVVTWVIHPAQARSSQVQNIWTNSETTKQRLWASEIWAGAPIRVVLPPHSYEPFRRAGRPWANRRRDVVAVGSYLWNKGLVEFSDMVEMLGLEGLIVGATWGAAREENEAVLSRLSEGPCQLERNLPIQEVARFLGGSRCLVSMSKAESASLVYYEAMNAGCRVFTLNVGAAAEQMGNVGTICPSVETLVEQVRALHQSPPKGTRIRGLLFDRLSVGERVREALEDIR